MKNQNQEYKICLREFKIDFDKQIDEFITNPVLREIVSPVIRSVIENFGVPSGANAAGHLFWVLKENDKIISELNGGACDKVTGHYNPVGLSPYWGRNYLKVMEFRHTELLEKVDELTMSGFNSLCLAEQKEEVKKTGNFETIRKDWDIMRTGGIKINQEKLDYNVLGGAVNNLREGNSNSVTNTLGKVAGIGTEIQLDGSLWVPGIEKNLLPVEKYPDFYIAIGGDVTSSVEVTVAEEAVAGASTLPQVEIAALGQLEPISDNELD